MGNLMSCNNSIRILFFQFTELRNVLGKLVGICIKSPLPFHSRVDNPSEQPAYTSICIVGRVPITIDGVHWHTIGKAKQT